MTANRSPDSGNVAVSDADLVRYIDGELTLDERHRMDAVLKRDAAMTDRLAVLRRRSARLSTLLAAAGPTAVETEAANPATANPAPTPAIPAADVASIASARTARASRTSAQSAGRFRGPADRGGRVWLRAAIVLLTVLGVAMAVPPVRAWVVDRLERITGQPAEPPSPAVAPAVPAEHFGVRFAVEGASFSIEMQAVQRTGRLIVRAAAGEEGSADVQGAYGGESFVVIPVRQLLRVQNTAESRADYVVTLPSHVRSATVRLADGRELPFALGNGVTERIVELTR